MMDKSLQDNSDAASTTARLHYSSKKHTTISAHVHLIPPFKHEMSFCRLTSGLTANTLEGGPTVYGRNTQSIAEQLIS